MTAKTTKTAGEKSAKKGAAVKMAAAAGHATSRKVAVVNPSKPAPAKAGSAKAVPAKAVAAKPVQAKPVQAKAAGGRAKPALAAAGPAAVKVVAGAEPKKDRPAAAAKPKGKATGKGPAVTKSAAVAVAPAKVEAPVAPQRQVPATVGVPRSDATQIKAPQVATTGAVRTHTAVTPKQLLAARATAATRPVAARPAAPAAAAPAGAAAAQASKKAVSQRHGFKINEHIVYPAHGVGRIVGIEEQEIAGMALELFVITFDKDKMTLRVPTSKLQTGGMRKLAEEAVVKRAMETLKGRARIKRTMWSRRAQEYEAKINSGDLVAVAEVVRDLYRSEAQPEQSYSERQLYELALDRMAREIAVVEKLDDRGAVQRITEELARSAKGRRAAAEEAAGSEGGEDEDGDVQAA